MKLAVALMSIAAVVWLGYQFWRLIFHQGPTGAVDLRQRFDDAADWFAGQQVYGVSTHATYPPATFILLWPFVGWLAFAPARWLWALTTVASLYWLTRLLLENSLAPSRLERVFMIVLPLSIYATGATIGNGQLILHLMPCLLAALLLVRNSSSWPDDLRAAALFLFALVKPSVTAPFFWILLFAVPRIRPAALVVAGYALLTVWASLFQPGNVLEVLRQWNNSASRILDVSAVKYSNGNLHSLLFHLEKSEWLAAISLGVLAVLGAWVYRFRHQDIWLLLGVTALVSRFFTYHGWYDDVLVLLPMFTLYRLCQQDDTREGDRLIAGGLFALTLLFMVAPGGLYLLPYPWNRVYVAAQTVIWLTLLGFLMNRMWRAPWASATRADPS